MKVTETAIPGVLVFEPRVFREARGWFMETWSTERYAEHGLPRVFAQDNVSWSVPGVLRGLHYQQAPSAQGKLVSALEGEIYDVAVDVRLGSPTFGKFVGVSLSAENKQQLWIPEGFAHGFVARKPSLVSYKASGAYDPKAEHSVLWNDPEIGIDWGVASPLLSAKDAEAKALRATPAGALPQYRG